MKLPRDLAGEKLAALLCQCWNYREMHRVGSHIVLETEIPIHQRVSIPAHRPLRVGTLNSILRQISTLKGVSKEEILGDL